MPDDRDALRADVAAHDPPLVIAADAAQLGYGDAQQSSFVVEKAASALS